MDKKKAPFKLAWCMVLVVLGTSSTSSSSTSRKCMEGSNGIHASLNQGDGSLNMILKRPAYLQESSQYLMKNQCTYYEGQNKLLRTPLGQLKMY